MEGGGGGGELSLKLDMWQPFQNIISKGAKNIMLGNHQGKAS